LSITRNENLEKSLRKAEGPEEKLERFENSEKLFLWAEYLFSGKNEEFWTQRATSQLTKGIRKTKEKS
jgi:hypothetical protein